MWRPWHLVLPLDCRFTHVVEWLAWLIYILDINLRLTALLWRWDILWVNLQLCCSLLKECDSLGLSRLRLSLSEEWNLLHVLLLKWHWEPCVLFNCVVLRVRLLHFFSDQFYRREFLLLSSVPQIAVLCFLFEIIRACAALTFAAFATFSTCKRLPHFFLHLCFYSTFLRLPNLQLL